MLHVLFLNPTWLLASCFKTASQAGMGACRAKITVFHANFRYVLAVVSHSCKCDAGRKVSIHPLYCAITLFHLFCCSKLPCLVQ